MGPRKQKTEKPSDQEIKDAAINAIHAGDSFFMLSDKGDSYLAVGDMSHKNIVENVARYLVQNDLLELVQAYALYQKAQGQMFRNGAIEQKIKDLITKLVGVEEDEGDE